jgi:hypothetical protein
MTGSPLPPFRLHSIAFAYPGNRGTIPLRDPRTSRFLGDEPEWNADGRRVAAAFVRGSRPGVRVCFARNSRVMGRSAVVRVGARARQGPGVTERKLTLRFGTGGVSAPRDFELDAPIDQAAGRVEHELRWYLRDARGERALGVTRHEWLRARKTPISPSDWASPKEPRDGPVGQPDVPWVYLPIMRWSCEWGGDNPSERELCDALLAGLPRSGLKYAVAAWNVRDMLRKGGGYCGGFYRMFQALAGAQGVHLTRRQFAVDWRRESRSQARWCAIVVETGGLNRRRPAEGASTFHDVDRVPVTRSPIETERERRYRFWGIPGQVGDGHSLNFLHFDGHWYIYDGSFQLRVELSGFRLPRSDPKRSIPIGKLGNFKEAYLDRAVNFMLGSLDHRGKLVETVHPKPNAAGFSRHRTRNGLSVKTSLIEKGQSLITFYWL